MARLLLEQDEALITSSTFKSSLDPDAYKKCRTALVCLKAAKTTHALGDRSFYRITRRCILEAKAHMAGGGDAVPELSVSSRMSHPEQLGSVHHVFGDLEGDTVTCLAFNPFHPCLLAVGTGSGTVSLFDAAAPRPVLRGLDVEHVGSVRRLCWSSCTNMLLSLGSDGSAVVWYGQPDTGLQLARKIQTTKLLTGATFCPTNENFVLVLTDDGAVHTISISTGRAVQSWHASMHSSCVAWGAGGRCVYLSDDKGAIHAVPFDTVAIRVLPGNKTTMRVSSKHVGSQVHSLVVRPHIPPTPQSEDVVIAGYSMAVALFIAGSSGIKMTVAIPCVPPPALFADCFSLAVFPSHVSDPNDGGHGLWFASGCSSSSVVQFFAVAAPPASSPSAKRAVDQPPEPALELRCDAHRSGITANAWHMDATFFASADANGMVVLWKRKPATAGHRRTRSFDANSNGRRPSADAGIVLPRK